MNPALTLKDRLTAYEKLMRLDKPIGILLLLWPTQSPLTKIKQARRAAAHTAPMPSVVIASGAVRLEGGLELPAHPRGVVAFSHGSGSGRNSPRNRFVAAELHKAGVGTLLLDLLTAEEDGRPCAGNHHGEL